MNKNLYLILIVAFIFYGCFSDDTSKAKVDLELIDAKVNSYEYSTAFLKFYYSDKGFSDSAEAYRMINQMINTFEANFIAFVDSGSTKADFDDMNLFLENNCSKCVDLIGEFKFNFSLEKNYLFKWFKV